MVLEARGIARRKAGGGRWEVEIAPGRWVPEEEAPAMTRPALPSNPPGTIERRFVEPEPRATPREREAWALCAPPPDGQGKYWADAAPLMGLSTGQQVKNLLIGYMASERIKGEPPGRMPDDERQRRAAAGRAQRATTSAAEGLPAPAAGPSSEAPQPPDDADATPAPGTPSPGAGDVGPTHAIAVVDAGTERTELAVDPVARTAEEVPASGGMAPTSSAGQLRGGVRLGAFGVLEAEVRELDAEADDLGRRIAELSAQLQAVEQLRSAALVARDAYRRHLFGGDA